MGFKIIYLVCGSDMDIRSYVYIGSWGGIISWFGSFKVKGMYYDWKMGWCFVVV